MNENVFIFEGYDGAGKSTLMEHVARAVNPRTARILGRKTETPLKSLSQLIEVSPQPLSNDAEMLLRIALEIERLRLVAELCSQFDFLFMDRGLMSLMAWVGYYNLQPDAHSLLFKQIEGALEGATMIFCCCDFETCWERTEAREAKSKKDLLGKSTNQIWYSKYEQICRSFRNPRYRLVEVNTAGSIIDSIKRVLEVANLRI